MFKDIVKPTGFDTNLHKLGLFFPYNLLACKGGRQFDFSVEIRDIEGRPDCKISDFGNNVWYRPKKALNLNWNGYDTYSNFTRAVKNCLIKNGYTILGWYERAE